MTDNMFELTGFQRDLLTVIAGLEKPSGQTVKEEIEKEIEEVNHGRLYPNLDALVESGLVDKGELDRRTNYYALSESGREALRNRRRWEDETVPDLSDDR